MKIKLSGKNGEGKLNLEEAILSRDAYYAKE
jgi:hypothetical protein